jgi:putative addiction module killer protein
LEVKPRRVVAYVDDDGRTPFAEWVAALRDKKGAATILKRVERVRAGNLGDSPSVGEGVRELRIDFGPGYRVYFAEHRNVTVVLLCGGDKSSQTDDIAQAKEHWKHWKEKNRGEAEKQP